MEIIILALHLIKGDVVAVPASMAAKRFTCDKVIERVVESKDTSAQYKGTKIWTYYCNKKDV